MLKKVVAVLALCSCAVLFLLTRQSKAQGPDQSILVIQGGTLIDGTGAPARPIKGLVIAGNRIREIVPANGNLQIPPGAKTVSAEGMTIIPGLISGHVHLRGWDGELFLHYGITTVFDLGNFPDWIHAQKEGQAEGKIFEPRIFDGGGYLIGGRGEHPDMEVVLKTPDDAKAAAEKAVANGASYLKAYDAITPDELKAVVDVAHEHGLNVVAHLGPNTNARQAVENGLNDLAHLSGVVAALAPPGARGGQVDVDKIQESDVDALAKLFVSKHVIMEPDTVAISKGAYKQQPEFTAEIAELLANPQLGYIPPSARDRWLYEIGYLLRANSFTGFDEARAEKLKQTAVKNYQFNVRFLKKFADLGGDIMLGTDSQHFVPPGLGELQELQLLVENVGISPMRAIMGATIIPAKFAHIDKDLGSIEAGKLADVVILKSNPLQNIHNLHDIKTVIQNGQVIDTSFHSWYQNPIARPSQVTGGTNPVPVVTAVEPLIASAGGPAMTLTIKGSEFVPGCNVTFNGRSLPIVSGSSKQLTVQLSASDLEQAGTYPVVVTNPIPEGGSSDPIYFGIRFANGGN